MEKLLKIATENISEPDISQVTVLQTSKNNYYTVFDDFDGIICDELLKNNDTEVSSILTMWKTGEIDLQSIKFRKALINLNQNNAKTNIVLKNLHGLNYKKLSLTI